MAKKIALDLNVKSDTVATANKRTQTATKQLKDLREQLASGELKGEAFEQAARRAAALQGQIDKVNKTVRTLANDSRGLDAFVDTAQGIAGGFAAAQGAAALFGSENEDLQKTFVKLQAAIALLNGVQRVSNVLRKDSALNTVLLGRANVTATATTKGLTLATIAFRKALISTGIGAAVVAVGLLVANFDKLRNLMRGAGKEIDDNIKGIDKKIERLEVESDILEGQLENLKLQGKEIEKARKDIMNNLKEQIKSTNNLLEELKLKKKMVEEERKFSFWQKTRQNVSWLWGRKKKLQNKMLNKQREKELEIDDDITEAKLRLIKLQKQILSLNKEQNDEDEKERKRKEAQDRRHRERKIQLIEDQEEREMEKLKEKQRREMELAKKNGDNIEQLEALHDKQLLALEQKFIDQKKAKRKAADAAEQTRKDEEAEKRKRDREKEEAQDRRHRDRKIQLIEDQEEREMAKLKEKHRREMKEAKKNGDNIKQLEALQDKELLALEQEFIDRQIQLIEDQEEREMAKLKEKHRREMEEAENNGDNIEELEAQHDKELLALEQKFLDRQIQLIEDQEEREMEMLKKKHLWEMEEAEKNGDNIEELKAQHDKELLALEQKFIDQKEAKQKAADEAEQKRRDEKAEKRKRDRENEKEQEKQAEEMMREIRMKNAMAVLNLMKATDKETEAEQRKAFRRNQALAIAETAITTYEAAQRAYNSQLIIPTPDAPFRATAAAAAAIAQGLARVKMIAGQKFRGAGGASGTGMAKQGQSVDFATRPQLPIRGIEIEDRRVFVLENDISRTQRRVRTIEAQSVID